MICPEGFEPYNEPYPEFKFGDLIAPNTPRTVWKDLVDLGVLTGQTSALPNPVELLSDAENEITQKDTTTLCIKVGKYWDMKYRDMNYWDMKCLN